MHAIAAITRNGKQKMFKILFPSAKVKLPRAVGNTANDILIAANRRELYSPDKWRRGWVAKSDLTDGITFVNHGVHLPTNAAAVLANLMAAALIIGHRVRRCRKMDGP